MLEIEEVKVSSGLFPKTYFALGADVYTTGICSLYGFPSHRIFETIGLRIRKCSGRAYLDVAAAALNIRRN